MLIFLTKSQLYSVCSHPSVFFFSEVCVEVHAVYVYIHCTIYTVALKPVITNKPPPPPPPPLLSVAHTL